MSEDTARWAVLIVLGAVVGIALLYVAVSQLIEGVGDLVRDPAQLLIPIIGFVVVCLGAFLFGASFLIAAIAGGVVAGVALVFLLFNVS